MSVGGHIPTVEGVEGLILVGEGGFAVVYRGRQPAFRRDVAVKVLRRSGLGTEDRQRFDRECQAMGALSDHPGIVTLYDAGITAEGQPYLVMAYVAGGTLADRLTSSGALPWQEVTNLGVRLSGALETAHRAGVLHRDIKPANILLSEYGEQLSDFGIARIQGGHETRSGVITASIAHAAPEILDGQAPTPQADVYALASTLHQALTGRSAFARDTDEGLLPMIRRVLTEQPPDLREYGVPDVIVEIIETAMAKDPEQRYATAEAFGLALREAQAVLGVHVADLAIVGARRGELGDDGAADDAAPVVVSSDDGTPASASDADASDDDASGGTPAAVSPVHSTNRTMAVPPPQGAELPPPEGDGVLPQSGDGSSDDPPAIDDRIDATRDQPEPRDGRGKATLIFMALLGAVALIAGVIIFTGDDDGDPNRVAESVPVTTVAPDPATSVQVEPTTTGEPEPTTTVEPEPTTTVESEPTTTISDEPIVTGPQIGVLSPSVGTAPRFVEELNRAGTDFGLTITFTDPGGSPADELATLIAGGQNPIVALAQDPLGADVAAISASADANPEVTFVVFDAEIAAPNVVSTSFAEHEGSFLVGAAAALTTATGRVGFLGGVDNDRIRRYEAGFVAGARHVVPTVQIDVRYFTGGEDAVEQESAELVTATSMYGLGADVIYHAGTSGAGLYQAAAETGRWAVGADTDRAIAADPALRPSILTSMLKDSDALAYAALMTFAEGALTPGVTALGVADGAVSLSTTDGHLAPIEPQLSALASEISTGAIVVPSVVERRALAPISPECPIAGCQAVIIAAEVVGAEVAVTLEANWIMSEAGNHLHYFWSPRYAPSQVGVDSFERFGVEVGEWDIDDRYPVYTTEGVVSLVTRTVEDTMLCLTPADAGHNVIDPTVFDCLLFDN